MKQIICTNCGAKYKLPDSFQAAKAKCKACGSAIDVAAQSTPEGAPGAAATTAANAAGAAIPARAKPATARKPAGSAAKSGGDAATPRRAGAERRSDAAADDDAGTPRRGAKRERTRGAGRTTKSSGGSKGLMIGSAIALLALVVVGVIWFTQNEDPATENTASEPPSKSTAETATKPPAEQPKDPAAPDTADAGSVQPSEVGAPAEASAEGAPSAKPAPKQPASSAKTVPTTREEVFNPKVELEPTKWPDDMSEEQRNEVTELVRHVVEFTAQARKAKPQLEEMGYRALPGLVEAMRNLDYFDGDATRTGFVLNRMLRGMTFEKFPVAFNDVLSGEEVPLASAQVNARAVAQWQQVLGKIAVSEAAWTEFVKQSKKGGGGEGEER